MRAGLPWPRGLRVRLILLLLAALLGAQLASLAVFLDDRGRVIRFALADEVAGRTLMLAEHLETLPADAHASALELASSRRLRFWISPTAAIDPAEAGLLAALAGRLPAVAGHQDRALRLADRRRRGRHIEAGGGSGRNPATPAGRHILASAALGSGAWVNGRVVLRPPPLLWAWPALTSFALAAVAVAAVVWFSIGRILRPMQALAVAADRLGTGDRPAPLALTGPTEARRLASAFNGMADRLTRLLDERDRTLAAIGHDLRSPVTAMRLRVEMVDDDETRQRLGVCLDEIQALVEAALALSRGADAAEPTTPLDLRSVLQTVVDDLAEAGGHASLAAPSPVTVAGRAAALKRALRNVADNAVRYGGAARIALHDGGSEARVEVDDDGPGIAPADRARVLEPFVRLEASRSRETGGSGLGLAIARAVIEAHGGTIRLSEAPGGGARVIITLPVQQAATPQVPET